MRTQGANPTMDRALAATQQVDETAVTTRMARAVLLVVLIVFVSEFFIMQALRLFDGISSNAQALVDACLSAGALLPALVFLFVRPMVRTARGWDAAQAALAEARDDLEARVRERTEELAAANQALRLEMAEREEANGKIQAQATLLDAVQQAVLATDPEGRLTYANRFAAALFGWDRGAVIGRPLADACSFSADLLHDPCGDHPNEPAEVEIRRGDATAFPALVTSARIFGRGGQPLGCVYVATDVSALKRAEEELRYSEAKYATLVEQSPVGIFICRDGKVVLRNASFLEITGLSPEQLDAITLDEIFHPADRPLAAALGVDGRKAPHELRIARPGGGIRWAAVRGIMVAHHEGQVLLGDIQDVTDRKAAEQSLRESREALQRLSHSLLTAQERERKRLARDLHDSLGQSLSFIYLMIDDILGPPRPDEHRTQILALRALLPRIQEAIEETRRLFTALRPAILDDLGLLPAVAWFLRRLQDARSDLEVVWALDVAEEVIPEDLKIVIFRILQEATNNAAKHSRAKRLDVGLEIEEGALRLMVMDDGVGFQPPAGPDGGSPLGLGLSSMRERAELSGGTFRLRTAAGRGTTVEVAWPLPPGDVSGETSPS